MPDVINKVISFISGDGENGSDKDVLLKQLAREISQNKYARFYRVRQGEVDLSFGQYVFNVYKTAYPLQIFLKDPAKESRIKQITLEAFLDKKVMDVIKRLSPDAIAERKKDAGPDITKQLEEDISALTAGFDSPRIAAADKCYDLITAMKRFVSFDFCSLLQKFDPEMKGGDFLTQPKFVPVDANILAPELASFLSVLPPFEADDDWKTVLEIIKYCNGGTDVVPLVQWSGLLVSLKDLNHSRILELISRLVTGNPILEIKAVLPHESLSASWLEQKISDVREEIAGIAGSQRDAQIKMLENAVFGTTETQRLYFYTFEKSRTLSDKGLLSYIFAPALNHLIVFIQDFLGKEVQELCDILLVRGQWTNNAASRQMSESFHNVLDISPEITKLDETLDEDGNDGARLRGALLRLDRDKTQVKYISNIVGSVNEDALSLIDRAVPALIVVGKHFQMLLDDYEKKPYELIMNWKELTLTSKVPISQRIAAAYKKINYFVQLMILETKNIEGKPLA